MITVAEGSLNISKSVLADVFAVSRSAVTQTCKKSDSVEIDAVNRIYRFLLSTSRVVQVAVRRANDKSLMLLQDIRVIAAKRNIVKAKTAGRPAAKLDFTALKRLIRAIVADIIKTNVAVEVENDTSMFIPHELTVTGIPLSPKIEAYKAARAGKVRPVRTPPVF